MHAQQQKHSRSGSSCVLMSIVPHLGPGEVEQLVRLAGWWGWIEGAPLWPWLWGLPSESWGFHSGRALQIQWRELLQRTHRPLQRWSAGRAQRLFRAWGSIGSAEIFAEGTAQAW
jgi:hypothetical protein